MKFENMRKTDLMKIYGEYVCDDGDNPAYYDKNGDMIKLLPNAPLTALDAFEEMCKREQKDERLGVWSD